MGEGGYRQINKTLDVNQFENYLEAQKSLAPPLSDIEQLSPRVLRILGQNPGKFTLQGTNTYVVGTGSQRLLIDTAQGYQEWADLLHQALAERSIAISHVLLTHWHGDHTGGVPHLIEMYPDLTTAIYKNSPESGQQAIEDGQVFSVDGANLRAIHAPGHSHDHMVFALREENALFTGDNVLGHGTSAVEELGVFEHSLEKMQSLGCKIGYPAHGDVISSLPSKIQVELSQKKRRESMCIQTLQKIQDQRRGSSDSTVEELVIEMHGENVDEKTRKKALEPFVDEVLRKLAEDEKVAFRVRKGEKRWFSIAPQ